MISSNKRLGTIYEQRFIVEALERGLEPHLTPGDYLPHDVLVSNAAGSVFKVQVKGTATPIYDKRRKQGTPRFGVLAAEGQAKNNLDCSKVDVLTIYVENARTWYVIPCLRLTTKKIWVYPLTPDSKGKYEEFKEGWEFFLT